MSLRTYLIPVLALFAGTVHAQSTYKIRNFVSAGTQNGNRFLTSSGFVGSSVTVTSSSAAASLFGDGRLRVDGNSYGWSDPIPGDFAFGVDQHSVNPDRGISATAYAGEANTPKTGTLRDVFGRVNLSRILDGESDVAWTLDLRYRNGTFITATGASRPELLLLERGANSKLGIRAILAGGALSAGYVMDFRTTGTGQAALTDHTLRTTEINVAQSVSGLGLSLTAFNLAAGTRVFGYQFFVDRDSGGTVFDGPDFVGFIGGATQPVPEPASFVALGVGGAALLRRRRRA